MPLILSLASLTDAGRIAEIHMAAFGSNAMLRAQFPTPAVRDALQRSIEWKALADIKDPKTTVLLVRDSDQMNQDLEEGSGRVEVVEFEQGTEEVEVRRRGKSSVLQNGLIRSRTMRSMSSHRGCGLKGRTGRFWTNGRGRWRRFRRE